MRNLFEFERHIGSGYFGCVILGRYKGKEAAIKLQKNDHVRPHMTIEARINKTLSGITGIPKFYAFEQDYKITNDELLEQGIEIPSKWKFDTYIAPIVSEYIDSSTNIKLNHINKKTITSLALSSKIFEKLEILFKEIHEMGVIVPSDSTLMVKSDQPYLCDFGDTREFSDYRYEKDFKYDVAENFKMLEEIKKMFGY